MAHNPHTDTPAQMSGRKAHVGAWEEMELVRRPLQCCSCEMTLNITLIQVVISQRSSLPNFSHKCAFSLIEVLICMVLILLYICYPPCLFTFKHFWVIHLHSIYLPLTWLCRITNNTMSFKVKPVDLAQTPNMLLDSINVDKVYTGMIVSGARSIHGLRLTTACFNIKRFCAEHTHKRYSGAFWDIVYTGPHCAFSQGSKMFPKAEKVFQFSSCLHGCPWDSLVSEPWCILA